MYNNIFNYFSFQLLIITNERFQRRIKVCDKWRIKMYATENLLTKTGKVLNYLQSGNCITWKECLSMFRCSSLAQRIQLLKKNGYKFKAVRIKTRNKESIARYTLLPIRENFKSLTELKRYVGLVENDLKCREDLEDEIKEFYKKYQ